MQDHFAAYRFKTYKGKRTPYLFHHVHARRRAKAGQRIGSLLRGFNAARERAAAALEEAGQQVGRFRDMVPHDLRHTRITTWVAEGRDVTKVKEAVGHADLRTTMQYTHLAREHLRSLVEDPDEEARERRQDLAW
jgi:site-specific recombinase XerD